MFCLAMHGGGCCLWVGCSVVWIGLSIWLTTACACLQTCDCKDEDFYCEYGYEKQGKTVCAEMTVRTLAPPLCLAQRRVYRTGTIEVVGHNCWVLEV